MYDDLLGALESLNEALTEGRKPLPLGTMRRWGRRAWVKGLTGWKVMSNIIARRLPEEVESLDESGERFKRLVRKLTAKGKSPEQARGIAAKVGRAKYGKKKFQAMAAAGRHHEAVEDFKWLAGVESLDEAAPFIQVPPKPKYPNIPNAYWESINSAIVKELTDGDGFETGVVYIADPFKKIEASPKEMADWIKDGLLHFVSYLSAGYSEAEDDEALDAISAMTAKLLDPMKVKVEPVTSPKSGKSGYRVTINPPASKWKTAGAKESIVNVAPRI